MGTKKASKNVTDTGISIAFESGQGLELNLEDLSDEMVQRLAIHGMSQKIGDSYAGSDTADEAFELASGMVDRLKAGDWAAARASGGGAGRVSMLVEALAAATGQSEDECKRVINAMDDAGKKQLKKHAAVAAQLAKITAERAAEKAAKAAAAAEGAELPAIPGLA